MTMQKYEVVPVNRLIKAEWNYKRDDKKTLAKLVENIRRNGLIENLIVREISGGQLEVVNGNHRLDAIAELNLKFAVVYNLGKVTEKEAKRIAIETNETYFPTNPEKFTNIMAELIDTFGIENIEGTMPYSFAELRSMINEYDYEQPAKEPSKNDTEGFQTIKIVMPLETYNLWLKWQDTVRESSDVDTEIQAFEYAIVEALNSQGKFFHE